MKRTYTQREMAEWYAQAVRDYEAAVPVVLHVGRVLLDAALSGDVGLTLALYDGDWRAAHRALSTAKGNRTMRPLGPLTGNWNRFQATVEMTTEPKTGTCDMTVPTFPDLEAKLVAAFDNVRPQEPHPGYGPDMKLDRDRWEEQLEHDSLRRAQVDARWKLAENQRLALRQQFVYAGTALHRTCAINGIPL